MIRTFRLYRLEKTERLTLAKAEQKLNTVRLASLAATAPRPLSRLLSDLSQRLTGERISGPKSRPGHWEMVLSGKWPARAITVSAGPPPKVAINVSIWLRRTSAWLVVFEANRALSDASAYLVAAALAGDTSRVLPMLLHEGHWKAIDGWLGKGSSEDGALLGGRFYKARPAGTDVEWIALRCTAGSHNTLLEESFQTAAGIGELLIQTPYLRPIDGSIICRIGRTGNIRVYGGEVSDGAVSALIFELEALWENVPPMVNR